jgi:hypothetical protein
MSKPDKNERLGEAKEMASAWVFFAEGNVHQARIEAKKVLDAPGASPAAKKEAADLLDRTRVDRAHLYAAILVACVWLTIVAIVYLR